MTHFTLHWWAILLGITSGVVFLQALRQTKLGRFYQDTPYFFGLGIFVWGDALVLAPFWFISSLLFMFFTPVMSLRLVLLFFVMRAGYEVVYWLNHQAVEKKYIPPLFRRFHIIKSEEAAILYQLLNMCQMILALVWLIVTFS